MTSECHDEHTGSLLSRECRQQLLRQVSANPAQWQAEALVSYARIEDDLSRLCQPSPQCEEAANTAQAAPGAVPAGTAPSSKDASDLDRRREVRSVREALDCVLRAMAPGHFESRPLRAKLRDFYSGAHIELAWAAIYRAQATLYMLYDVDELPAQLDRLEQQLAAQAETRGRLKALRDLSSKVDGGSTDAKLRTKLRELYEAASDASEGVLRQSRTLRNSILGATFVLFLAALLLGLAHLLDKGVISMCIPASPAEGLERVCPFGGRDIHRLDVFTIELMGALGGLLSVIAPLASGERIKTPYRVFNQQLLLKPMLGATTAVAGVVLVEAKILPGIAIKSSSEILAYAFIFGVAQQLVTGAVDRRASSLAEKAPAVKDV